MKRTAVRALLVALIIVAIPVAFMRAGSRVSIENVLEFTSGGFDQLPELLQRIRDFHRIVTRDGRRVLEVSAKEANFFKDDRAVLVKEPKIVFYDGGEKFAVVASREAKIFFSGSQVDELRLSGSVEFELERFRLSADNVSFNSLTAEIEAEGNVVLRSPELSLRGAQMHMDITNRRLVMNRGATMRVEKTQGRAAPNAALPVPGEAPVEEGTDG